MQVQRSFIAILFFTLLILNGCGYHAVGSNPGNLDYGRTVWVDFIGNTTSNSTAQTVLRRVIMDEFHAMRSLFPATSANDSDLKISGLLKSYSIRAVSYTAADLIREYRLTIEVELEARTRISQTPLWKGVLAVSQDFPAADPRQPDLALQKNAEEEALVAASRKLAHTLLSSMEESF